MELQTISTYLTDKLNANSKGILFRTGYLIQSSDTAYEFKTHPNYYTETINNYTPVMFDLLGDPQKVPNQDITDWNILMSVILTGDKETDADLILEQEALDEFRLGLINNPIDTLDGYRLTVSASPISRDNDIKIRGAKKRITVSMEISISTGLNVYFGNDVGITLALEGETPNSIFALSSSIVNGKTEETESDLTGSSALTKTIARDGTTRYDMSFLFDNSDIHNEVVKGISAFGNNVNTAYDLVLSFPIFNITKKVIISGGTISMNANDYILVNVQFTETV